MRFMAISEEVDVGSTVPHLRIEKWCAHAEYRGGQQNASSSLILDAGLDLPGEEGRQKRVRIDCRPKWRLQPQRQRDTVIAIEEDILHRAPGSRVLRNPDAFFRFQQRQSGAVCV